MLGSLVRTDQAGNTCVEEGFSSALTAARQCSDHIFQPHNQMLCKDEHKAADMREPVSWIVSCCHQTIPTEQHHRVVHVLWWALPHVNPAWRDTMTCCKSNSWVTLCISNIFFETSAWDFHRPSSAQQALQVARLISKGASHWQDTNHSMCPNVYHLGAVVRTRKSE